MNGLVILTYVLMIIAQIAAIIAGQARFYALCLDISLKKAYLFLFLPLITLLVVGIMLRYGLLPYSWSDELYAMSSFVGQVGMLYAVFKLMTGSCKTTIPGVNAPA